MRRAFEDICLELAELSRITECASQVPKWWTGRDHPMLVLNPGFVQLSKRYWEVGRQFRDAYAAFLLGKQEGLAERVAKVRRECLQVREDVLAMLRARLEPTPGR
jgi:hypothetical protein